VEICALLDPDILGAGPYPSGMSSLAVSLALVLMGRPVFHDMTIAELAASSELVLEVEQASPFTGSRQNAEGCEEQLWHVVVKGVVSGSKDAPAVGSSLAVITNPTGLFDCMARKKNGSGVSFSAPRYTPSAPAPAKRFLVFVRSSPRGFILATQSGWDSVEKKSAVAK
jgi:hypothetical protein